MHTSYLTAFKLIKFTSSVLFHEYNVYEISFETVQGSAKRRALGCVNSPLVARGSQEVGITQPRDHSLADPCTLTTTTNPLPSPASSLPQLAAAIPWARCAPTASRRRAGACASPASRASSATRVPTARGCRAEAAMDVSGGRLLIHITYLQNSKIGY